MKKILISLMLVASFLKAQVKILKSYDKFDEVYRFYTEDKVVLDNGLSKVIMNVMFKGKEGALKMTAIAFNVVDIFKCSKNDELIIIFENGTKLKKDGFNILTCTGNTYFNLNEDDIKSFGSNGKISELRITNGYLNGSFQCKIPAENQEYFSQIIPQLNKPVTEVKN